MVIFKKKSICEACREHQSVETLKLPNRKKISVCEECRDDIRDFISHPISSSQFNEILGRIEVSKDSVWNIPWGSTPNEVLSLVPPKVAEELKGSKSIHLMSYFTGIADHTIEISFTFDEDGLNEIMVTPHGCLLDMKGPLTKKYGSPKEEYDRPGLREYRVIWEADGFEVEADMSYYGFASISFISQRQIDSFPKLE